MLSLIRYLSLGDIAERYGCRESKVAAWIRSNELKAVDTSAKRGPKPRWRVSPEALEAFEAVRANQPTVITPIRKQRRQASTHIIEFIK